MTSLESCAEPRTCTPEETWRRLKAVLPVVGVTRVADLTWLDLVGIPVFQAIRPNARTLSVSQGKGVTPAHARVSAAMEAIELWHAENPAAMSEAAAVGDILPGLGYDLDSLRLARRHCVGSGTVLHWVRAMSLADCGGTTVVPQEAFHLDSVTGDTWSPPLFDVSSNGLASGNTLDEALTHALYELIERDALAGPVSGRQPIDLGTVSEGPALLVDRITRAEISLIVEYVPSSIGIHCFLARMSGADIPVDFVGSGAHADPDVALGRALTEAAQARLAAISGTREDLNGAIYDAPAQVPGRRASAGREHVSCPRTVVRSPDGRLPDWRFLAARITAHTGMPPMAVDLTRPALVIAVVRVFAPGLGCPDDY